MYWSCSAERWLISTWSNFYILYIYTQHNTTQHNPIEHSTTCDSRIHINCIIIYIYIFIISQNVWRFFLKKSSLVFSPTTGQVANNLNSRAVCIRLKKFKVFKNPAGAKGFSIWPMDYKDSGMRSIMSTCTCLRQPYQRMSLASDYNNWLPPLYKLAAANTKTTIT